MVAEESLRGVTSNPSIFEKAILGSDDYDDELEAMAREYARRAQEIYDADRDQGRAVAADVLRPVWDETNGARRLRLARGRARPRPRRPSGTIDGARDLLEARSSRPNVMIKIPGTPEGVGAIEQAIYEGINVNVTLLFAVEAYETVAEAYIRGLERRLAEGKSLDVELGGQLLRLAGGHQRRQAARGRSAARTLAGTAALANARARLSRASSSCSPARAGRRCATPAPPSSARCGPRPGSRTPTTRTRCTSTSSSPPTRSTRCRWPRCMAVADHGKVSGPTAEHDPQRGARRAAPRPGSTSAAGHRRAADRRRAASSRTR